MAMASHILLPIQDPKRAKECVLAIESGNVPEPLEDAGILVEYVEGGEDKEAAYEEAWQVVNDKTLRGWKLRGMEEDPVGDGVKLLWDASHGRRRQG